MKRWWMSLSFIVSLAGCGNQPGDNTQPQSDPVKMATPSPSTPPPSQALTPATPVEATQPAPSPEKKPAKVAKERPQTCERATETFDRKTQNCRAKTFADWCESSELTYAQSITLSKVLNTLKLSTCSEVPQVVNNIRILALPAAGQKITDLSPLAALTQLEVLIIPNNQIVDASPLATLKHLEVLSLRNNAIRDITFVKDLPQLKRLDLAGNPLQDLKPLSQMPNLVRVNLDGVNAELGFTPKFQISRNALPMGSNERLP